VKDLLFDFLTIKGSPLLKRKKETLLTADCRLGGYKKAAEPSLQLQKNVIILFLYYPEAVKPKDRFLNFIKFSYTCKKMI
jgi:hypothetical protein